MESALRLVFELLLWRELPVWNRIRFKRKSRRNAVLILAKNVWKLEETSCYGSILESGQHEAGESDRQSDCRRGDKPAQLRRFSQPRQEIERGGYDQQDAFIRTGDHL